MSSEEHNRRIRHEFAKQADRFEDPSYSLGDPRWMRWIISALPPAHDLTVLDVAGGTGLLARALAHEARHVAVLDLTPEMLVQGRKAAQREGASNVTFEQGDAAAMPFAASSFDLVVSRFALHHFAEPFAPLKEMRRVCRLNGFVAVADIVAADPELADRYNAYERRRDPSHAVALTSDELERAFGQLGLDVARRTEFDMPVNVHRWLAQAQTPADEARKIENELRAELRGGSPTGMRPQLINGRLNFTYRFLMLVGCKSAP